ncbi:hypothetical protein [Pseudomonas sp. 1928-m]|uniref:hypothetical protein n=1 Tax=Pseudomonas sp. 1928-m TaxID=3033804 RepID=UPI0023DEB72C|nr:hypothetical protein [Pseudomonas sp. 1928-m]MDF3197039.1 hypothetical protein [Pseudomonas sp. 1928-m]
MNIPEQEIYISGVLKNGNDLELRLITDYHPGAEPAAYSIFISKPKSSAELISFAEDCKLNNDYLYIYQKENNLILETEHGEHFESEFSTINFSQRSLDTAELKEIMNRTYSWYLSENEHSRLLQSRIHEALKILNETQRRVLIKTEAHEKGSTASTLYSQQAVFINRVIKVLET